MWDAFMNKSTKDESVKAHESDFADHYLCMVMDESSWDDSKILETTDFKTWRGGWKPHLFVWFMFKATESKMRAKILDAQRLG